MIIRITAVRKASYPDLMAKYENPIEHACDVQEGQEWLSIDGKCPEGMCPSAWGSMREFVEALARGEGNFYDGWMKNPMSAMISCNDGFRPVSFYIEISRLRPPHESPEIDNQTIEKDMEQKFCQSCGMPLTPEVLGTNADGSKNEEYCIYCYKDGKFLQDCTMDEMIEHCAQFVDEVNKGLPQPITKEEYIGQMKMYFPRLKRWRKELTVSDAVPENPALAGVKELIGKMADTLPIAFISSVDAEGYPCTKAMLSPRVRDGIKVFYFTTNTFSLRVAHYKANPKASIYFCDAEGFKGMMLRGMMEVLTDAKSKEMIWRDGDEEYYPGGVTDPNYCVLEFTATDGRFYSDFYPRSFVIE